jgi:peptide-methionine (S)-S-oxide reductase
MSESNFSSPLPRKRLPIHPSEEHLRKQAKRRVRRDPALELAQAQFQMAREYGCKNWAELMHVVETMNRGADRLSGPSTRDQEPLPRAANQNDIATVRGILASGQFTQHDLDLALARAVLRFTERHEIARLLVEHGADPDGQYGANCGPIVFVTGECLDPDGLQFLIDHGADVTFSPVKTKYGHDCPLSHWLGTYVRGSNEQKHRGIEILLKAGAHVPAEVSPPVLAIHRGDAKALADLLDKHRSLLTRRFADMPYGNIALAGATLLHCAVEFNELECLDELFKRYADINMTADVIDGVGGQTPVFHVINTQWDSQFQTLEYLVKRVGHRIDLSVNASFRWYGETHAAVTPVEFAEEAGQSWGRKNAEAEKRLLASLDGRRQIIQTIRDGDVAAVGELLDARPDLLTPELWPPAIFEAKSYGITKLLLDRGLNPDLCSAPRKPLHLAVCQYLPEIVELLIERGADVNQLNPLGERPLDLLDAYEPRPVGDPDARRIFAALVAAGAKADIQAVVRTGDVQRVKEMLDADPALVHATQPWPPLFSAARSGRFDVAKLLIERGADVNARNDKGNTPLWFACQSPANAEDRIAVARLLLESGARVRETCEDNSTALHFAARRGPVAMVELLIRHGAREWQGDKNGKRAIDYARDGVAADKPAIVELLDRPVIRDPNFKAAVAAIHSGNLVELKSILARHPSLVHDRAVEPDCYPPSYFRHPRLIWFVANNPTLVPQMPGNIVEIAETIINVGAEKADLDYTLELVMTSSPAKRQGLQIPLMKVLMDHGAEPGDLMAVLAHWELEPVAFLLERGHPVTAPIAAALGKTDDLQRLLLHSDSSTLQAAFGIAVINRQVSSARICLQAGADVNGWLPVHSHSTPAHQAAVHDDVEMLHLLVESGARLDIRDTLWNATPLSWAVHTGKPAATEYLRSVEEKQT